MLITMLKDVKWSIDYKAISFYRKDIVDVKDDIAQEMIINGYAVEGKQEINELKKSIELPENFLIKNIENASIQNENIETTDKKNRNKKGR